MQVPLVTIMRNSSAFPQRSDQPAKLNLSIQVEVSFHSEAQVLLTQALKKFSESVTEIPVPLV